LVFLFLFIIIHRVVNDEVKKNDEASKTSETPTATNDYGSKPTQDQDSDSETVELAPVLVINSADYKDTTHTVIKVVDGDTIDIDLNGKTQRVRLIGVNTPETVHPNKTVECFGKEASDYTRSKLLDKKVVIEVDDSQGMYDKYNRLLAYVYVDGKNFNLDLIVNGYAYEYTYNIPYRYQKEFKEGQVFAEKHETGLWAPGACN